jgi:DNA invertase Pin-like site-specific DNA recombinase
LVVHSIDRLARNLANLESLVSGLNKKGVTVRFVKENLTFSGGENPMNMLMFQMLGAFAQFERSMIRERQREGIAAAKKEGRHLGRVKTLSDDQETEIRLRVDAGETKKSLAAEFRVSRQTIYAILSRP